MPSSVATKYMEEGYLSLPAEEGAVVAEDVSEEVDVTTSFGNNSLEDAASPPPAFVGEQKPKVEKKTPSATKVKSKTPKSQTPKNQPGSKPKNKPGPKKSGKAKMSAKVQKKALTSTPGDTDFGQQTFPEADGPAPPLISTQAETPAMQPVGGIARPFEDLELPAPVDTSFSATPFITPPPPAKPKKETLRRSLKVQNLPPGSGGGAGSVSKGAQEQKKTKKKK